MVDLGGADALHDVCRLELREVVESNGTDDLHRAFDRLLVVP